MKKIILLTLSWALVTALIAQNNLPPVYEIKSDTALRQILGTDFYQMLEDKKGEWAIEQVNKPPVSDLFHYRGAKLGNRDTISTTYWVRYTLKNVTGHNIKIDLDCSSDRSDFYLFDSAGHFTHLQTGKMVSWDKKAEIKTFEIVPVNLKSNEALVVYNRINNGWAGIPYYFKVNFFNDEKGLKYFFEANQDNYYLIYSFLIYFLSGVFFFAALSNIFFYIFSKEKVYLYFALSVLVISFQENPVIIGFLHRQNPVMESYISLVLEPLLLFFFLHFVRNYFHTRKNIPRFDTFLKAVGLIFLVIAYSVLVANLVSLNMTYSNVTSIIEVILVVILVSLFVIVIKFYRKRYPGAKDFVISVLPLLVNSVIGAISDVVLLIDPHASFFNTLNNTMPQYSFNICILWMVTYFSWTLFQRYDTQKKEIAQSALQVERLAKEREEEKNLLVEQQKNELEEKVHERTMELENSLRDLKSAQSQLVQSEKMASLGELTAGIAHEIQNPLNFVNNFSEVSNELIDELQEERNKAQGTRDEQMQDEILNDIKQNLEKINHHGKRADAIVKGMLQHSRSSTGVKEPTDINAIADEYLRLSYHGLRAKDNSFNATMKTDFDNAIGKINIVPQDIGRVLLNLYNNAFYAVNEKKKTADTNYEPTVSVVIEKSGNQVSISVSDNGNGIPQKIVDKIFQPFFTTKPTGQGTGLGLSLSYDIIKAHGGEIKVETKEGEGSKFVIQLPMSKSI
jgi:two-component system NtrC family sensor kinase